MEEKNESLEKKPRIILFVVLILIALLSFFLIAPKASSPETYQKSIEYLNDKQDTVLKLTGAATATSTVITLIPGDTATPIAEKIADLTSCFLWVLCAIFLEKYLLAIIGAAAFRILIPIGCLLAALSVTWKPIRGWRVIGAKMIIFGLAFFCVIPVSVKVSRMIDQTYKNNIEDTINLAEETQTEIQGSSSESETESASDNTSEESSETQEDQSWTEQVGQAFSNAVNSGQDMVENAVSTVASGLDDLASGKLLEKAKNFLNSLIEAVAVMIVTSCVIPILVLVFFFWLVKLILEIEILGGRRIAR